MDAELRGHKIHIRPICLEDCTERYVGWLKDPQVNACLETRWTDQNLNTVREFVTAMIHSDSSHLFAICRNADNLHIGNIKIGPVNVNHRYADVSYLIGDKSCWGKGFATEAIGLVVQFGFTELKLHRLQAGVYDGNAGSLRALTKNDFRIEGRSRAKFRYGSKWVDHIILGRLKDDDGERP